METAVPIVSTQDARPARVIIGLDVGTTAAKAVAFGLRSEWQHAAVREYPLLQPSPGWQVQDLDTVLAAAAAALTEAVAAADGAEVAAICVSSAMHGLIALDSICRPLTPLLTWADARAGEQARALRRSGRATELHRRTGTPVHPMTPLTKLIWFAEHDPQVCARARWWVGLKDYLLHWLTGTLVTELSSASGTGMMDLERRAWSPSEVALAGISDAQLPPILATTATLGLSASCASRVGLPVGTPVVVGAGDGPLGNLGTGAMTPGTAGLSLGTSGAVRVVLPRPTVDPRGSLFCYALTEDAWVTGGAVSNGGIVVRWAGWSLAPDLAPTPGAAGDRAILDLAASVPAGSDGLIMLPYLLAERAPLWDPDLPGAYLGLRRGHTRAHLVRAAVEGVALQLALIVDQLHQLQPVTSLRVSGGTFRSPFWGRIIAAMVDRPLHAVSSAEGSALGAAALGAFALGYTTRLRDAAALVSPSTAERSAPIRPEPDLVATYRQLRESVPRTIQALSAVADLLAASQEHDGRSG